MLSRIDAISFLIHMGETIHKEYGMKEGKFRNSMEHAHDV